jgi:hypothetical protein
VKGSTLAFVCVIALWFGGILQVSLAPHLKVGFGGPDFGLIALGTLGLMCDRRGTTILGFGAGWIGGALAGTNLTLYILSRSLAGFLLGWCLDLGIQRNYLVSAIAASGVTLIAELTMLFAGAHRGPLIPYLVGTLVTTVYDGVIAAILFSIVSRMFGSRLPDRY